MSDLFRNLQTSGEFSDPIIGVDVDLVGFVSNNTAFGDKITAIRVASASSQFFYGVNGSGLSSSIVGDATLTLEGNLGFENLLTVSSSTTIASSIIANNLDYLRYVPGYEFGAFFTTIFTPPTTDGFAKAGIYDGDNGFWIGYKEHDGSQQFGICRIKDGVEYFVPQSEFNLDKLDGLAESQLNVDQTKGNIWNIRGGYLGFAPIVFEIILPNGRMIPFHKIEFPNSSIVTHISNMNLPARFEVSNGTTSENVSIGVGSFVIYTTDGTSASINDRDFSYASGELNLASPHVRQTIISFRNSATFQGTLMPTAKENRIPALLNDFSIALSGQNKVGTVELILIPSSLNIGGIFTPKNSDSVLSYSIDSTYNYNGTEEIIFATTFDTTSDKINKDVRLRKLLLRPNFDAVFAISSTTGLTIDTVFSNSWSELF